ncbi:MAG: hypothetical protein LIO69_00825 [Oscillospiraceae bacterium]|nr:hypothetical protein [Oscillospiraceae bacterium]
MQSKNLSAVLNESKSARDYFGSLPDYIQGGVMLHSDRINSEETLHECVESIFREFE